MTSDQKHWLFSCVDRFRKDNFGSINPETILRRLSVEVISENSLSDGAILNKSRKGQYQIILKTKSQAKVTAHRQRFTLAHELGHLLLIEKYGLTQEHLSKKDYYLFEDVCNEFAGQLLVDARYIKEKVIHNSQDVVQLVYHLSFRFNVSYQVASYRLCRSMDNVLACGFTYPPLLPEALLTWGYASIGGFHATTRRKLKNHSAMDVARLWCDKIKTKTNISTKIEFARDGNNGLAQLIGGYIKTAPESDQGRGEGELKL